MPPTVRYVLSRITVSHVTYRCQIFFLPERERERERVILLLIGGAERVLYQNSNGPNFRQSEECNTLKPGGRNGSDVQSSPGHSS